MPRTAQALGVPEARSRPRRAPLREYSFNADINSIEEVTVADDIDARDFLSGTLIVRFHRAPVWRSDTAEIHVRVWCCGEGPLGDGTRKPSYVPVRVKLEGEDADAG